MSATIGQNGATRMGALIVFESVYGNTRTVAEAIAEGLDRSA